MHSFNSALLTVNLARKRVRCLLESEYDINSRQFIMRGIIKLIGARLT